MSRLARLYPRAWRERYETELLELLASRQPSIGDRIDLVRGAVDAWRNPHLVVRAAVPAAAGRQWWPWATVAAVGGGLLAIAAGLAIRAVPMSPSLGYKDSGAAVGILVAGIILTAVAAVIVTWTGASRRAGRIAASAMLVAALGLIAPWPVLIVGFYAYIAATIAFAVSRWLGDGEPLAGLAALGAIFLALLNVEDDRALLAIPFGLVWIVVGVGLARQRALLSA